MNESKFQMTKTKVLGSRNKILKKRSMDRLINRRVPNTKEIQCQLKSPSIWNLSEWGERICRNLLTANRNYIAT